MSEPPVSVRVRVRLATIPGECVAMLMMLIVPVRMLVLERFVRVLVLVPFCKV